MANSFLRGEGIEIGALHALLKLSSDIIVTYLDRLPKNQLIMHYPEIRKEEILEVQIVDDGEKSR